MNVNILKGHGDTEEDYTLMNLMQILVVFGAWIKRKWLKLSVIGSIENVHHRTGLKLRLAEGTYSLLRLSNRQTDRYISPLLRKIKIKLIANTNTGIYENVSFNMK